MSEDFSKEWERDCLRWHRRVLVGTRGHWCPEWDFMPIDETLPEFEACICRERAAQEG